MTPSSTTGAKLRTTVLVTLVATLGGFLFGYDSGVINGTVDGLQTAFQSQSIGTGFSVASMLLGCAVGAFLAGRLADVAGRRTVLLVSALFFLVSAWGSGIAGDTLTFVFYRILGGLAVGAASVMAPAYISEIAPPSVRGRLSGIQQIAIIFGLTGAFLANLAIARSAGSSLNPFWFGYEAWRWMFWMEILPASVFFLALFAIPESPRFLVAAGRRSAAVKALSRVAHADAVEGVIADIETSLAGDHRPSLRDLFGADGRIRPIVWVGVGLATFQQLVGINVVFYYGAVLWQSVGFSENDALLINVISGSVSILACAIGLAVIDHLGRKPLLLLGSVGMAATLAVMTIAFATAVTSDTGLSLPGAYGPTALIAANAYVFFFNMSWGPVMWVMLGEMFPNQMRGSGLAVSGFFQWIANFGITMTFPIFLVTIGLTGAYGAYAVAAAASAVFVVRAVRETRGLSLEQMTG